MDKFSEFHALKRAALSYARFARLLDTVVVSIAFFGGVPLIAQSAVLSGHLTDQSGSIVPNAHVTVTNTAIKAQTQTEGSRTGVYQFPPLIPGEYVLTATAPTFGTVTVEHLVIEVGSARSEDVTLAPSSYAQM